jgi:hypothetical protein
MDVVLLALLIAAQPAAATPSTLAIGTIAIAGLSEPILVGVRAAQSPFLEE